NTRATVPSTLLASRRSKRCRTPTRRASLRLVIHLMLSGVRALKLPCSCQSSHSGEWRNGRRARFRSVCPKGCEGSNPSSPTRDLDAPGTASQRRGRRAFAAGGRPPTPPAVGFADGGVGSPLSKDFNRGFAVAEKRMFVWVSN